MKAQINTSVKMPPALHARVQKLAEIRERTVHGLMLQAIEKFVNREEQREALRQEALIAHEEYMSTGLHLTGEEAHSWLLDLEQGNDVEPPQCHV